MTLVPWGWVLALRVRPRSPRGGGPDQREMQHMSQFKEEQRTSIQAAGKWLACTDLQQVHSVPKSSLIQVPKNLTPGNLEKKWCSLTWSVWPCILHHCTASLYASVSFFFMQWQALSQSDNPSPREPETRGRDKHQVNISWEVSPVKFHKETQCKKKPSFYIKFTHICDV